MPRQSLRGVGDFLTVNFYDAHCHLQDERLIERLDEISKLYDELGVAESVVNGTSEKDWRAVSTLAGRFDFVRPSFGLHPWKVGGQSGNWKEELTRFLDLHPEAAVGEIGLDRWIEGFDLPAQEEAFRWQFEQAVVRNRPVSIHCLKAWGRLLECLMELPRLDRGFLLHSYGGPREMVEPFAKLGAFFSFSGYFALDRKKSQLGVIAAVPLDRILVETDAPDMSGPESISPYRFTGDNNTNHPGNIVAVYRFLAETLDLDPELFREIVEENYKRFFNPES